MTWLLIAVILVALTAVAWLSFRGKEVRIESVSSFIPNPINDKTILFEVDSAESAFAELKENGLERELSGFDIERHDGTSWKVFYVVAPDGLCYWFGERQTKAGAESGADDA